MNDFDDMTEAEMLEEAERIAVCSRATYDQANSAIDEAWNYYCAARRDKFLSWIGVLVSLAIAAWGCWR